MVELQKKRIEDKMTKMVEEIDKTFLRKMQGDMHRCAAGCCDNESFSVLRVNNCVENCSKPLQRAQLYVQGELERVQNRLQRCVMECNDTVRDKIRPDTTQNEVNLYTEEFEKCATKCVDVYCDLLPSLQKTIIETLASEKYVLQ